MKLPRVNESSENGKLLHLQKETISYFKACGIMISLFLAILSSKQLNYLG